MSSSLLLLLKKKNRELIGAAEEILFLERFPWERFETECFPVAQMVEHGASNAKIMGLIPRESKSWSNVKL